jgi:hypothetical protein
VQRPLSTLDLSVDCLLEIVLEYFNKVVHLLLYSIGLELIHPLLDLLQRHQQLLALEE